MGRDFRSNGPHTGRHCSAPIRKGLRGTKYQMQKHTQKKKKSEKPTLETKTHLARTSTQRCRNGARASIPAPGSTAPNRKNSTSRTPARPCCMANRHQTSLWMQNQPHRSIHHPHRGSIPMPLDVDVLSEAGRTPSRRAVAPSLVNTQLLLTIVRPGAYRAVWDEAQVHISEVLATSAGAFCSHQLRVNQQTQQNQI